MWDFIKWFVVIDLLGWVIFPSVYTLFGNLKDRGFTISKILGLLVWGYLYWLINILDLTSNSAISAAFIFLVITIASILINRSRFREIYEFIRTNWLTVIFYEIVFLMAFALWAFIRSLNPEVIGTEKPMELTFMNGINRSPAFPPNDPWLSGYAISYYYFGYLLVSLFMSICGTTSGVAFNLAVALWFALITVGSAGLLFNLLAARTLEGDHLKRPLFSLFSSLLAPFMILIISNAEGFFEILHARGVFWNFSTGSTSSFWQWLGIQELNQPPSMPLTCQPNRLGGTWWWRASRVLQDFGVAGNPREIIDEFPFFSFYLADFHPHLISLPFVIMVLTWTYSFLKSKSVLILQRISFIDPKIWIGGFLCGSLIFINTWDFPIYAGLLVIVYGIKKFLFETDQPNPLRNTIFFAISFGIASIIFYLPFLIGLSSQAGGFLPSLVFRTRGIHFLVMFFPQIIFVSWLLIVWSKRSDLSRILRFFLFIILACIALFAISILYIYIFAAIPDLLKTAGNLFGINTINITNHWQSNLQGLLSIYGSQDVRTLVGSSVRRLISDPSVILFLSAWITLGIVFILSYKKNNDEITQQQVSKEKIMVVVMILIGSLLCLVPEFFYLRDQFGWRMNTIFKFYFQSWILLSLAASYFVISKFEDIKTKINRVIFIIVVILIISVCLVYPYFALKARIVPLQGRVITLDGNSYLENSSPEEYKAIKFLREVPYGVISEAIGGSYSNYGRISKLTGLPTVLGWPGHELQWRGGTEEIGSRESDINKLYSTDSWEEARQVIDMYGIDYIYIGQLEESTYSINEEKFGNNLSLIYQQSDIKIYAVEH